MYLLKFLFNIKADINKETSLRYFNKNNNANLRIINKIIRDIIKIKNVLFSMHTDTKII